MASLQQTVPGTTDLDGSGNPVTAGAFYWALAEEAVAAYMMPGQSDTADDWTGNGNDGTWTGTAAYTDAPFGRAFVFGGSDAEDRKITISSWYPSSAFSVLSRLRVTDAASWPAWAKIDYAWSNVSTAGVYQFGRFTVHRALALYVRQSNNTQVGPALSPYNIIDDGEWHTAVATADGSNLRVYLDGASGAAVAYDGSLNTNETLPQVIGNQNGFGPAEWQGNVSEHLRIPRAVTQAEIDAFDAGPAPTITANSLAFDAGVLTATVSATSNNGAVSNYVILQYRPNSGTPWVTVQEGATLTYTPTLSGEYSHVYAPSNDAGIAEPVRSNVVSVTLESPRFVTPLITPLLVPMGA